MPGKRGNHEGHIRQRKDSGRWEAQITVAPGEVRSLYGKTREEVAEKLKKLQRERDQGLLGVKDERQTVAAYFASWLETMKIQGGRESTWISYEHRIRLYIVPKLGKVKLAKLTPQHVRELHTWLLTEKKLSPTTVNHTHGILAHALADALRDGTIARNVAAMVTPPSKAKRQKLVYTPAQVDTLLKAATEAGIGPIVTLAVTTGIRLGESLALRWCDVELDAARIHVRQGRSKTVGGWTDAEPKTDSGKRSISLTTRAVDALRTHRKAQLEHRIWLGAPWQDNDYVFPNEIGGQQFHSVVEHAFDKVMASAGLPRIKWHDLRHTAGSLLLLAGVPVAEVSEMLGHADPRATFR